MLLFIVLEMLVTLFVLVFVMSQIVVPLWKNTPVFWLFRKTPKKEIDSLVGDIAIEKEKQVAKDLENELEQERSKTS